VIWGLEGLDSRWLNPALRRRCMIENEFYSQAVHGPYETFNIGDLVLEDGGTLRQCELAHNMPRNLFA
jgi:hypothetical protein